MSDENAYNGENALKFEYSVSVALVVIGSASSFVTLFIMLAFCKDRGLIRFPRLPFLNSRRRSEANPEEFDSPKQVDASSNGASIPKGKHLQESGFSEATVTVNATASADSRSSKSEAKSLDSRFFVGMQIFVGILSTLYSAWDVLTYRSFLSTKTLFKMCDTFVSIDIFMFFLLRASVLTFFLFRLRLASQTDKHKNITFAVLFSMVILSCILGFVQLVSGEKHSAEYGCIYYLGGTSFLAQILYVGLFIFLHSFLCIRFIQIIKDRQRFISTMSDKSDERNKQLGELIQKTKYGFICYMIVATLTDFFLAFATFFEPDSNSEGTFIGMRALYAISDLFYILDAFTSCICVMSTYKRFRPMLTCKQNLQ